MTGDKIKELISALDNLNSLNFIKIRLIKKKLIAYGKKDIDIFLKNINSSNQKTLIISLQLLGEIGDAKAIPFIKEIMKEDDLWGETILNIGIALIKLEKNEGISFLKNKVVDINAHRDLRINSAKTLLRLNIKGVFTSDEIVDVTGESMTEEWSKKLLKLIDCLKKKKKELTAITSSSQKETISGILN